MRRLGGNPTSKFSVIDQVDDMLPAGPIVVHCERTGGGARSRSSSIFHIIHIMHIIHILNIWFTQAISYEGKSFKIHSICLRNICLRYFWNSVNQLWKSLDASGDQRMISHVWYVFVFEWCLNKHLSRMISIQKTFPSGHCLLCQKQGFKLCFLIRRERLIQLLYMKVYL